MEANSTQHLAATMMIAVNVLATIALAIAIFLAAPKDGEILAGGLCKVVFILDK